MSINDPTTFEPLIVPIQMDPEDVMLVKDEEDDEYEEGESNE